MPKKKINILILSTYYPPIASIASNRIFSFAKYLDKDRFTIHVVTLEPEHFAACEQDAQKLDKVFVHRVKNSSLVRPATFHRKVNRVVHKAKAAHNVLLSLLVLDEYRNWRKKAVEQASAIIEEHCIDIILSSYAPVATHLAAAELKKRHPQVKWIADMRDEMSKNPYLPFWFRWRLRRLEKQILQAADAVTAVSKPILDDFIAIAGREDLLYREIRNGYDFEMHHDPLLSHTDTFVITYTGSFYGPISPHTFFVALDQLVQEKKIRTFVVNIVGSTKQITVPLSLQRSVVFRERVPLLEAVEIMRQSDLLLLIHPLNGRKGVYTGKLFEYMAVLRPILAIVDPTDVAAELIGESHTGYVASFNNIEDIKQKLLSASQAWKEHQPYNPDMAIIQKHHRQVQANILQELILKLLQPV